MGQDTDRSRETIIETRKRLRKIFKTSKNQELTKHQILYIFEEIPNFLGCFGENEVQNLFVVHKPGFFIVNIDSSNDPGSHWIAVGIFKESIEVFDPLGFKIFQWSRVPCSLLKFIHHHSTLRNLVIADRVQSDTSKLCGFYCVHYIFQRQFTTLDIISSRFSVDFEENDFLIKSFY